MLALGTLESIPINEVLPCQVFLTLPEPVYWQVQSSALTQNLHGIINEGINKQSPLGTRHIYHPKIYIIILDPKDNHA